MPARTLVLVVGLVVGMVSVSLWLRADAEGIVDDAPEAHTAGDCQHAIATLEEINALHRVMNPRAGESGDDQTAACELLLEVQAAQGDADATVEGLGEYLDHDGALWQGAGVERAELLFAQFIASGTEVSEEVEPAFSQLVAVLAADSGQADRVEEVLRAFLAELEATGRNCFALDVLDWMAAGTGNEPALGDPLYGESEPEAGWILGCARDLAASGSRDAAIEMYSRFQQDFPDHELVETATAERAAVYDELDAAEAQAEHELARELLDSGEWCGEHPADYQAAPFSGDLSGTVWTNIGVDLPDGMRAQNLDEVQLVVCLSGPGQGREVDTCEYTVIVGGSGDHSVAIYAQAFRVSTYELHTGHPLESFQVEAGSECPNSVECSGTIGGYTTCPDWEYAEWDDGELGEAIADGL